MKKRAILIILFMCLLFALHAEETTSTVATMEISAFKDAPTQQSPSGYLIGVMPLNGAAISSSNYTPYDISGTINSNSAVYSEILKIFLGANIKTSFHIDVDFSPFINSENGSAVSATYSFTKTTPAKEGTAPGDNDSYESSGNYTRYQYQYRYTPSLSITANSGTTITNSTFTSAGNSSASIKIDWSISKVERRRRTKTKRLGRWGSWGSWESYAEYSGLANGATLIGIDGESNYPVGDVTFNLSVSSYSSMEANVDYYATVMVTMTAN